MGNQQFKPALVAVQALLQESGLTISDGVLLKFFKEVAREKEEGRLREGTLPIFKMIQACIADEKCQGQDSLSEAEKEGNASRRKGNDKQPLSPPCQKKKEGEKRKKKKDNGAEKIAQSEKYKKIYPALSGFRKLTLNDSASEETSSEEGENEDDTSSQDGLNSDEQTELVMRKKDIVWILLMHLAVCHRPQLLVRKAKEKQTKRHVIQIATSLIPEKERRRIRAAFPVFEC